MDVWAVLSPGCCCCCSFTSRFHTEGLMNNWDSDVVQSASKKGPNILLVNLKRSISPNSDRKLSVFPGTDGRHQKEPSDIFSFFGVPVSLTPASYNLFLHLESFLFLSGSKTCFVLIRCSLFPFWNQDERRRRLSYGWGTKVWMCYTVILWYHQIYHEWYAIRSGVIGDRYAGVGGASWVCVCVCERAPVQSQAQGSTLLPIRLHSSPLIPHPPCILLS